VHVIAEDREAHDVNCEDPGENFEAISDPVFPMREIPAGVFINPAQKGASNTAIDQMKHLNFIVCKDFTPIDSWHCRLSRYFETNQTPGSLNDSSFLIKVTGACLPFEARAFLLSGDRRMKKYHNFMAAVAGLATISLAAGCQEQAVEETAAPTQAATAAAEHGHEHAEGEGEHAHGHGAGPHDGTLADWGGGKYHVEFTVDHDKQEATVYVLGSDEKSPAPVKTDKVLLSIGDPELMAELLPVPLEGESDGLSSRFVGRHEKLGIVQEYAGTMSAEIEGTPYTGDFKEEAHDHK